MQLFVPNIDLFGLAIGFQKKVKQKRANPRQYGMTTRIRLGGSWAPIYSDLQMHQANADSRGTKMASAGAKVGVVPGKPRPQNATAIGAAFVSIATAAAAAVGLLKKAPPPPGSRS